MTRAVLNLVTGVQTSVPLTSQEEAANAAARLDGLKAGIIAAAQADLDAFAQTRGYDGILSACTYATSTTPSFAQEGQRCVLLRDQMWGALTTMLAEVEAGTRPVPVNYAAIKPELPALTWSDMT